MVDQKFQEEKSKESKSVLLDVFPGNYEEEEEDDAGGDQAHRHHRDDLYNNESSSNNNNGEAIEVPTMTMEETLQKFLSNPSVGILPPSSPGERNGAVGDGGGGGSGNKSNVRMQQQPTAQPRSRSSTFSSYLIKNDNTAGDDETAATAATTDNDEEDLIFESSLDLTEERLQHVYNMFHKNSKGNISYENLRHGLEVHSCATSTSDTTSATASSPLVDDTSFRQLIQHLDRDQSGDITYPEFAAGIRLLMLRKMVFESYPTSRPSSSSSSSPSIRKNNINGGTHVQIMDYNATQLETYTLNHDHDGNNSTRNNASKSETMNIAEFYFQDRPSWVKTRWIDVSSSMPSFHGSDHDGAGRGSATTSPADTLKMLAIKYSLHPLALEDALSPEHNIRPKADVYSTHYFIMVPIFIVEPLQTLSTMNRRSTTRKTTASFLSRLCRISWWGNANIDKEEEPVNNPRKQKESTKSKVGKVHIQTTSIFVTVPSNDTIITYNGGCGYNRKLLPLPSPRFASTSRRRSRSHNESRTRTTAGGKNNCCWRRVQKELGKSYSKLRQYDAHYLTYALLDQAVDLIEPIIQQIRNEIVQEQQILKDEIYNNTSRLDRIHDLRAELERIVRKLKPFMRLLVHVIEDDTISAGATIYIRDVLDNLECYDDDIKDLIALCQSIDDEVGEYQSRRMDRTLYILTVISAIFLPAQFLTGVWGMNFLHMPELDDQYGYLMFWVISIVLMASSLFVILRIHYYGKFW